MLVLKEDELLVLELVLVMVLLKLVVELVSLAVLEVVLVCVRPHMWNRSSWLWRSKWHQ